MLLLLNLHITIDKGSLNFECGRIMAQVWLEETLPEVVVIGSQYTTCTACYMTVEKRNLQMHLEQDCPKRTVECAFCGQTYVFCNGHSCTGTCALCHKPANECTCDGCTCNGSNNSGNSSGNIGNTGNGTGSSGSSSNGNGSNTTWTSTLYNPMYYETMIPNYKIPTKWRGQLPDRYACFLCCMEYIYNIQHSTPDYYNNTLINGTEQYAFLRYLYKLDYEELTHKDEFRGVYSSYSGDLLSLEGFQYVKIERNEIRSYLDSQYLIILNYSTFIGPSVSAHAVLVIGYDNNNFIVVDPGTGEIRKQKDDGDYVSIIAISPNTNN